MTNILHNKLNKHMIDIIKIYILPCSDNLISEKNVCLNLLLDKTWNIFDDLNNNCHLDVNTGTYTPGLQNTKIKKISKHIYKYYWSIRTIL